MNRRRNEGFCASIQLGVTKTVSLSSWGEAVESRAHQAASHARRFQPWVDNTQVRVQALYTPLVRAALVDWKPAGRVYVALDVSVLKGSPFVLIRVSLIYRGRALPLAWNVLRHASTTVGYSGYAPVLEQALSCRSRCATLKPRPGPPCLKSALL